MAADAGLARETVNKLERGHRPISRHYAERLAPVLGVRPEDLMPPQPVPAGTPDPLGRLESVEVRLGELEGLVRRGLKALGVEPPDLLGVAPAPQASGRR